MLFFSLYAQQNYFKQKRQDLGTKSAVANITYELLLSLIIFRNIKIRFRFLIRRDSPQWDSGHKQRYFLVCLTTIKYWIDRDCSRSTSRYYHSSITPPVLEVDIEGTTKNKLCTETVVTVDTYSMSGQLSGFSSRPPSITKRSTCSLVMPWYGCSANVAISQSTTPKDLENKQIRTLESRAIFTRIFFLDDAEQVGVHGHFTKKFQLLKKYAAMVIATSPSMRDCWLQTPLVNGEKQAPSSEWLFRMASVRKDW